MDTKPFMNLLGCDTARISEVGGKKFLIIGTRKNTKDDPGQWVKDGEPIDFDYVAERIVASGETDAELMESAREYKHLSQLTWEEYFRELQIVT